MVLLSNPKKYFKKQHAKGIGNYYTHIYGGGVFLNSLKTLGKYLLKGGKSFYKYVKPKAITFAKESFQEIKPKVQKVIKDASAKLIDDVLTKPMQIKQSGKEILDNLKSEMKLVVDESVPSIVEKAKKSFHEQLNGGGSKLNKKKSKMKLSKKNQKLLNEIIEFSNF